eukprot:1218315-Amphidinium_carterae.1
MPTPLTGGLVHMPNRRTRARPQGATVEQRRVVRLVLGRLRDQIVLPGTLERYKQSAAAFVAWLRLV